MQKLSRSLAMAVMAGALILALSLHVRPVSASSERSGNLHLIKNCSEYTGAPGDHCTFTSSNLLQINIGSKIYVDQMAGIPSGLLDSNVLIYVGPGDWAVGRCTLDLKTNLGLCTFSDGTGPLTGFHARVDVSSTDGVNYHYDGTYSFSPVSERDPDK